MKLSQKGFTLIELSVVLVIAVVILSMAIGAGLTAIESQRIKTTYERMNYIIYSLDKYARTFNHLPCPADPTRNFGDTLFGVGVDTDTDGGSCDTLNANILRHGATNVIAGSVPVVTLDLPPIVGEDGWGRRITYVVDQDLTFIDRDSPAVNGYTASAVNGNVTIRNAPTGTGSDIITNASIALISHGSNGHGAWQGKGNANRINKGVADNTPEGENSHIVTPGNWDNIFVQIYPTSTYDDILVYRSKWQLGQY